MKRKLYHGGKPGLKVGDKLLPPDQTGAQSLHLYGSIGRNDMVYVTSDEVGARMFAAAHPSLLGWLYEVQPDGDVYDDADYDEPGVSFCCRSATILRVIKLSPSARHRALVRLGRMTAGRLSGC